MPTRGAICWTCWYSALISQILKPKSYHRLGMIDIFSVCRGIFWNIFEQMAISGVRSVPKNTNSATTLKSSPAQSVHTCAIRSTVLYSVRHILKSAPKISERQRVRARCHPKNSATGVDRRALGRIGNIQSKLLKALYGKGSLKNSSMSGRALRGKRKHEIHLSSPFRGSIDIRLNGWKKSNVVSQYAEASM